MTATFTSWLFFEGVRVLVVVSPESLWRIEIFFLEGLLGLTYLKILTSFDTV